MHSREDVYAESCNGQWEGGRSAGNTKPQSLDDPFEITPEDLFHYIYAVLHAPTYRSRYAEFLRIDFPRVPLTRDRALFYTLATKGAELVALHSARSTVPLRQHRAISRSPVRT